MATAYSCDRLLSLRNNTALLNDRVCLQVSQRWAYVGAVVVPTASTVYSVTSSVSRPRTRGEIPVIIGHRTVFTINNYCFEEIVSHN